MQFRVIIFLLAGCAMAQCPPHDSVIANPPAGCVFAMRFEDGKSLADLSGNGNNVTESGGVTWLQSDGGVLRFDGAGGYLYQSSPANLPAGSADRTICVWCNPDAAIGTHIGIVDYGVNSPGQVSRLSRDADNERFEFNVWGADVFGTIPAPAGQWHFVCVTVSGGTNALFVNGRLDGTTTSALSTTVDVLKIASGSDGSYFAGIIAEARIYNRALSAAEIADLYQRGKSEGK